MGTLAFAQSIPKPSVPEFTVRYVDNSYYVSAPTTIIDQYGNSRIVQGYVENKTVEFSIKNQVFTPYTIPYNSSDPYNTGQTVNLMYNIRLKSPSYNDWQYVTHLSDGYLIQSNSSQTIANYQLGTLFPLGITSGEQVAFQVQALIGYVHRYPVIASWTFNGTESDWSNTQTLTIPSESLPNMGPTSPPDSVSADLVVNLALVAIAISVVTVISLLLYVRHLKKNLPKT
jgi:hypothetical protein